MNRLVGLSLLVVGILLLVLGINAGDSVASSFSRLFTGSPTDRAVWMLIGGAVATVVGAALMARRPPAGA